MKKIESVNDLPVYGTFVLVYGTDEKIYDEPGFHVCEMNDLEDGEEYREIGRFLWITENGALITNVTHWMPLPKKPN